ncbi:MAG TPA: hypothetical protein PKN85_10020 [Syntrophorhabdaceae bacterium]|nr:hypothetical protein [Syntrophorhabdaceae bacterium]HOD76099.1 hypothetical protein [Syntrophorhabdaceae bacterium]
MAKKGMETAKRMSRVAASDSDRTRLRRFLFLWAPIIVIVLVGFYVVALDPAKPTGRTIEASVIGKEEAAGGPSSTSMFRVRFDNGEEAVMFIPERQVPPPPGRILAEEYTTSLLSKRTYRYLRAVGATGTPGTP